MFVLKKNPTCWWPVKVKWPDEKNAGRDITYEFEIEVRLLDQSEIEAQEAGRQAVIEQFARDAAGIAVGEADPAASGTLARKLNDYATQTFVDTICNWRGMFQETETGTAEVPMTEDLLRLALERPRVRNAIQAAVNDAIHGGARSKN